MNKEYTTWRKFLAWVGLISLTLIAVGVVMYLLGDLSIVIKEI